jgi:hypothetical protein
LCNILKMQDLFFFFFFFLLGKSILGHPFLVLGANTSKSTAHKDQIGYWLSWLTSGRALQPEFWSGGSVSLFVLLMMSISFNPKG